MRVFSFHHYSSCNKGGIEFLVKHLKNVVSTSESLFFELYFDRFSSTPDDEINIKADRGKLTKLYEFFQSRTVFKRIDFCADDTLIIFSPKYLLFVPSFILKNVRVILVQSNRYDIYVRKINKLALYLKGKYVNDLCVYSKNDLDSFSELISTNNITPSVIPRGCRISSSSEPVKISKKIVTVARISEVQKNFVGMVEVIKLLPEEYTLDIYGGGSHEEILKLNRLIEDVPNITYKGVAEDVRSILRNYSLFIMTSHFEGFGQTLIEARSQGLPLIVYDTFDALRTIIDNGYNGYIIPYGDQLQFSNKIVKILSSDKGFNVFSMNAIQSSKATDYASVSELWRKLIIKRQN